MNATGKTITLFGTEYQVVDEHDGLITIQELKSFLPEMESELYEQLKEDISSHGIHDPILYKDMPDGEKLVIEGHTRLQAAKDLGITGDLLPSKPVQEEFDNINDLKLWMLKHQFQRRNLSAVEKLRLAMLSKDTIEAKAKENLSKAGKDITIDEPVDTAQEIANLAGVSRTTATRYMSVIEKAPEKIAEKLHQGDISIFDAYKRIHRSKKAVAQLPDLGINYAFTTSYRKGKELVMSGSTRALIVIKNKEYIKDMPHEFRRDYTYLIIKS